MTDRCPEGFKCETLPPPDAGDKLRAQYLPQYREPHERRENVAVGPPIQLVPPPGQNYYADPRYVVAAAPPPPTETPRWFPIDIQQRDGSLRIGLNAFGLAKGGISLGEHTGPYGGSEVLRTDADLGLRFAPNGVGVGANWHVLDGAVTNGVAGVGITGDQRGLNIGGGAQVSALTAFGAGGEGGVRLGQDTGPYANANAYAGPAGVNAGGEAYLNQRGIHARGGADVGVYGVAGVSGEGRAGIGAPTEAHGDVSIQAGNAAISTGAGLYPNVRPNAYIAGRGPAGESVAQLNPPYDARYAPQAVAAPMDQQAAAARQWHHPEPTPENIERITNRVRQHIVDAAHVRAHEGESYLDIMCKLHPNSAREDLKPEARYLAQINGNKKLHEGTDVMTLTPTEVESDTRIRVARIFGWPNPYTGQHD